MDEHIIEIDQIEDGRVVLVVPSLRLIAIGRTLAEARAWASSAIGCCGLPASQRAERLLVYRRLLSVAPTSVAHAEPLHSRIASRTDAATGRLDDAMQSWRTSASPHAAGLPRFRSSSLAWLGPGAALHVSRCPAKVVPWSRCRSPVGVRRQWRGRAAKLLVYSGQFDVLDEEHVGRDTVGRSGARARSATINTDDRDQRVLCCSE